MKQKMFTKEIEKKLQEQYPQGADMEQDVVCKISNPYGNWKWYIMNQDPEDPDYLWGIVKGFEVEMGSISKSELENTRIKFAGAGLPLERDLHFKPRPAKEVWADLNAGKHV